MKLLDVLRGRKAEPEFPGVEEIYSGFSAWLIWRRSGSIMVLPPSLVSILVRLLSPEEDYSKYAVSRVMSVVRTKQSSQRQVRAVGVINDHLRSIDLLLESAAGEEWGPRFTQSKFFGDDAVQAMRVRHAGYQHELWKCTWHEVRASENRRGTVFCTGIGDHPTPTAFLADELVRACVISSTGSRCSLTTGEMLNLDSLKYERTSERLNWEGAPLAAENPLLAWVLDSILSVFEVDLNFDPQTIERYILRHLEITPRVSTEPHPTIIGSGLMRRETTRALLEWAFSAGIFTRVWTLLEGHLVRSHPPVHEEIGRLGSV